ncbi:MAG: outer membrane protein assembly factor BamB family protein [Planctomycetota bacterium]
MNNQTVKSWLLSLVTLFVLTGCSSESDLAVAGGDEQSANDQLLAEAPARSGTASDAAFQIKGSIEWTQFRGPTGMGISEATDAPLNWSLDENIVWKTPMPGPGASSPVVFGDRIYITCYTGYFIPDQPGGSLDDLQRHLIAIDRKSGDIIWDKPVKAKLPEEERIRDHGFAASTPAVDKNRIYVFFGKTGVIAFDHDGNQQWQADVGSRTHGWGSASSPVIYGDLLLVNASVESENLVALNKETGAEVWRAGGIREAWNTPLVVDAIGQRKEVIIATHGTIQAFNPADGEQLWTCKTDITWYMVPSVVAYKGVIYCLGGRSGVASLAVRTGGSGDVTATHRLWTSNKGSNVSSPVFRQGHLYWMNDQRGIAYAAKAETGDLVYEERVERAGQVYSSAVLANDRIYYLNRSGRTFVVSATPEFELLATNELRDGSQFNGSPVFDRSRLLIRSDRFLYCIGQ